MTTSLARTQIDAEVNAEVTLRPLRDEDVTAADELAYAALKEVGEQFGFDMGGRDPASVEGGIAHSPYRGE